MGYDEEECLICFMRDYGNNLVKCKGQCGNIKCLHTNKSDESDFKCPEATNDKDHICSDGLWGGASCYDEYYCHYRPTEYICTKCVDKCTYKTYLLKYHSYSAPAYSTCFECGEDELDVFEVTHCGEKHFSNKPYLEDIIHNQNEE